MRVLLSGHATRTMTSPLFSPLQHVLHVPRSEPGVLVPLFAKYLVLSDYVLLLCGHLSTPPCPGPQFAGCQRTPRYGQKDGPARFCQGHKVAGMYTRRDGVLLMATRDGTGKQSRSLVFAHRFRVSCVGLRYPQPQREYRRRHRRKDLHFSTNTRVIEGAEKQFFARRPLAATVLLRSGVLNIFRRSAVLLFSSRPLTVLQPSGRRMLLPLFMPTTLSPLQVSECGIDDGRAKISRRLVAAVVKDVCRLRRSAAV